MTFVARAILGWRPQGDNGQTKRNVSTAGIVETLNSLTAVQQAEALQSIENRLY
jgi:hypothetical protein